jgi:hypothetical protein
VSQVALLSYLVALALGGVGIAIMFVRADVALGLVGGTVLLGLVAALWLTRIDMSKPAEQAPLRDSPRAATTKAP